MTETFNGSLDNQAERRKTPHPRQVRLIIDNYDDRHALVDILDRAGYNACISESTRPDVAGAKYYVVFEPSKIGA